MSVMSRWSVTPHQELVVWAGSILRAAPTITMRRHLRDRRLAAYRAFEVERGWPVLGIHEDLSRRYPVAPLIGASSAQIELALAGQWAHRPAVVASVLVQAGSAWFGRRHPDAVVQLTVLDAAEIDLQFTAVFDRRGPQVAMLAKAAPHDAGRLEAVLSTVGAHGDLCPGDHVAADGREFVHSRSLRAGRDAVDIEGPLRALGDLAAALA